MEHNVNNGRYGKTNPPPDHTTHGLTDTPIYIVWQCMKSRCYNKEADNYKFYGARGITVCDEWKNDFIKFHEWAKDKWRKKLELDRIDSNGNYCPENCQFITHKENSRKTRRTVMSMDNARKIRELHKSKKYKRIELAEMFGCSIHVIKQVAYGRTWN